MRFSPPVIALSAVFLMASSASIGKKADHELDPQSVALVSEGVAAQKAGQYDNALGWFETALAVDPRNRADWWRSAEFGCKQCCDRRGGLDAEATLPRAPDKARLARIDTKHRDTVGRKAAQSRPFALDRGDWPVDNRLQAMNRDCDIDIFRRGVMRIDRRFVMRAEPHAAFALTVAVVDGEVLTA